MNGECFSYLTEHEILPGLFMAFPWRWLCVCVCERERERERERESFVCSLWLILLASMFFPYACAPAEVTRHMAGWTVEKNF